MLLVTVALVGPVMARPISAVGALEFATTLVELFDWFGSLSGPVTLTVLVNCPATLAFATTVKVRLLPVPKLVNTQNTAPAPLVVTGMRALLVADTNVHPA